MLRPGPSDRGLPPDAGGSRPCWTATVQGLSIVRVCDSVVPWQRKARTPLFCILEVEFRPQIDEPASVKVETGKLMVESREKRNFSAFDRGAPDFR
jgi:hypothetical protein